MNINTSIFYINECLCIYIRRASESLYIYILYTSGKIERDDGIYNGSWLIDTLYPTDTYYYCMRYRLRGGGGARSTSSKTIIIRVG